MDKTLKEKLTEINVFTYKNKINPKAAKILEKNIFLLKEIDEYCSDDINISLREKLHRVFNNFLIKPKCECGLKNASFLEGKGRYSVFCSEMCDYARSKSVKKQQNTMKILYDEYHPGKIQQFNNKRKQTMIERYGYETPIQNEEIKQKMIRTKINKYGEDFSKKLIQKTIETNRKKYNTNTYAESLLSKDVLSKINSKEWLIEQHHHKRLSISKIARNINISIGTISSKMKKFKIEHILYNDYVSNKEILLRDIISRNYNGEIILNNKKIISPYELDIFIPENRIAFEFNGLYWHSEQNGQKNSNYHYNKFKLCKDNNIKLITIFENDFDEKPDIIESRIKYLLKKSNTLYARKCMVKEISFKEADDFFNRTHIQGNIKANKYFGLFYQDKIFAAMSFGHPRFNKNYEWELLRFSNELDYSVIGGASKLFKYFIKNHLGSVISYADSRWSDGNLYNMLGFKFIRHSKPNYYYLKINKVNDTRQLYSRLQFQKHKLKNKLEFFDPELTEWENMKNNGYDRIWDCGNSVWVYDEGIS